MKLMGFRKRFPRTGPLRRAAWWRGAGILSPSGSAGDYVRSG